jgi:predicted transcriptional regulator
MKPNIRRRIPNRRGGSRAGKATVAECEEELKMNRRTLQRDLKLLVGKGLVREIGTGPTDPTKYYKPLL